jgi:uncharacterized lipoprotein
MINKISNNCCVTGRLAIVFTSLVVAGMIGCSQERYEDSKWDEGSSSSAAAPAESGTTLPSATGGTTLPTARGTTLPAGRGTTLPAGRGTTLPGGRGTTLP